MKVKFIKTRTVQDGSGLTFHAGNVYDLADTSGERWIRRGVAVLCDGDEGQPATVTVAPPVAAEPESPSVPEPAKVEEKADPVPETGHTMPRRSKPNALSRDDMKRK